VGFAGGGVNVSLNTGTSFGAAQLWHSCYGTSCGWSDNNTYPRMLADVLGSGLPGVVGFASSGVVVSSNTANILPDLVSSIVDGLGVATTITYAAGTNKAVVTKGLGTTFPMLDMIGPMYVVSRVDASDGIGGTRSVSHAYSGGRIDTRRRSFVGFAQASVKDLQTNLANTTTYRQDFPYVGLAASTAKSLNTLTLSQSVNIYQFSNAGGAASVGTPSVASAPYQVSLSQNVSSGADLDGSSLPTVTTSYQYDIFGNATQVVSSTSDGFTRTTASTYTNDTALWYLGRLTRASVTSVAP
jgi:hypothetical protein